MDDIIVKLAFENMQKTIDELIAKNAELEERLRRIEKLIEKNKDDEVDAIKTWKLGGQ